MPIVSSETIADAHTQADGRRYITHYFTDHLGVTHKLGPKKDNALGDAAAREIVYTAERAAIIPNIELKLDESEQQNAISRVENGEDALVVANNFKHSTQKKIAKKLIYWMMRERDPQIVIWLEPLITYINTSLTDTQIKSFLDITQVQLNKIREKAKQILNDPNPCQSAQTAIELAAIQSEEID